MSTALALPPDQQYVNLLARYQTFHDPAHMHLGVWETPGDAELPGRVRVAPGGGGYGVADGPPLPAEEAATALRLRPTRRYGRVLTVLSEDVAVPGLLDARRMMQVPQTAAFQPHVRPLASDLGGLCAVLMRGLLYRWQKGRPHTVMTAGYRVPPCNPMVQVYRLWPKLDALEEWARKFARERRLPLFLGELWGDSVMEEQRCERTGRSYSRYVGKRVARVASIATTDPAIAAEYAMMARMMLS